MCRNLFANRKRLGSKIQWAAYDRVYWDGVEQAMKSFPRLFQNWVTKQVSGMCGCTSARAHWVKDLVDKCPSCGRKGDSSTHVTRCEDPARIVTFHRSIDALAVWMEEAETEPNLKTMITTYLKGMDRRTMRGVVDTMKVRLPGYFTKDRLNTIAKVQDKLGWDCMLEGRIPKLFVLHQRCHLAHKKTRMTAKRWAKTLITKLLKITHKQWLLRNAKIHIKRKGDMNEEEHDKLRKKIEKLIWTDPEDLLPGDEHLLNEDFDSLGRASAIDQILWVAEMEASIAAANHDARRGRGQDQSDDTTINTNTATREKTGQGQMHDTSEGSGVWKKEKWK